MYFYQQLSQSKNLLQTIFFGSFIEDNVFKDLRIVLGGVSCVPMRLNACEDIARESLQDDETISLASSIASRGATPLNYNHFKIPLMENLVKRALRTE